MSHFHSYLHTKDMDKAAIKQQAFAWPPVPHQLKNLIPPLNPTVVKELVTSRQLESNMSPTQYRNWRTQLQSNSDFFTKLLTKHPSVDEPFLTALYNGVVFQSEAQVVATQKLVKKLLEQNAVVFQPMKNSLVKAEPLSEGYESTVQVSASFGTTRDRAPSSGSAEPDSAPPKAKAAAEEKDDVLMKMSFPDTETFTLFVLYAQEVHRAIKQLFFHLLVGAISPGFRSAAFRNGLVHHFYQHHMDEDPIKAYELLVNLKFQSVHGVVAANFARLSALSMESFHTLFNDWAAIVEELLLLEDKYLNLQVLVWFLICAIEKHWSKDLGSPADKYGLISAIERAREEELLTVESLRAVFVNIAVVHRQDILPSTNKDKHEPKGDFVGAVTGRGAGGKGGKVVKSGVPRYNKLPLVEASEQPAQSPLKTSASQAGRGQPAQVQQDQPDQREVCQKYYQGKCDMKCGRRHVFPCTFHYVSGSKKCTNADKCKFSHEFTAPGLANCTRTTRRTTTSSRISRSWSPSPRPSPAEFATTLMLLATASRSAAAVPLPAAVLISAAT